MAEEMQPFQSRRQEPYAVIAVEVWSQGPAAHRDNWMFTERVWVEDH